jgi:hypothetical protein
MQPNAGNDCIDNNDPLQLKSKQGPEGKLGREKGNYCHDHIKFFPLHIYLLIMLYWNI